MDSIPKILQSQSLCLPGNDTTAFNLVLKYIKTNGEVELVSSKRYYNGPLIVTTKSGEVSSLDRNIDYAYLSKAYRDSLSHSIENLVMNHDEIEEMYFITQFVF